MKAKLFQIFDAVPSSIPFGIPLLFFFLFFEKGEEGDEEGVRNEAERQWTAIRTATILLIIKKRTETHAFQ